MKRPKYKVNDNVVYTEEYKKTAMLPWSNSTYVISKVNRKFIFTVGAMINYIGYTPRILDEILKGGKQ